tara:strand:- start:8085 stop:8750 length:666 start_codon:yes stop_codon:yes gene_type:complete
MIFVLPVIFFKEDKFGRSFKEKLKFLSFFIMTNKIGKILIFKKRIKLGDIKIVKFELEEFLKTNNIEDLKINFITDSNSQHIGWSDEQKKMREEILEGNYKEAFNTDIHITKDNIVTDGHHRICALKEKYSEEYKILVYKNYGIKWKKLTRSSLLILWNLVSNDNKVDINNKFLFIHNVPEVKKRWEELFNDNDGWTTEKCYLLIQLWNKIYPTNKIHIDE